MSKRSNTKLNDIIDIIIAAKPRASDTDTNYVFSSLTRSMLGAGSST